MADLDRPVHGRINTEAAISQAAYEVLMGIYASDSCPYAGSAELRENLQAELTASLAEIPDGGAEQRGIRLGDEHGDPGATRRRRLGRRRRSANRDRHRSRRMAADAARLRQSTGAALGRRNPLGG